MAVCVAVSFGEEEGSTAVREERVTTVHQKKPNSESKSPAEQKHWRGQNQRASSRSTVQTRVIETK